jgi:hypothetical protein
MSTAQALFYALAVLLLFLAVPPWPPRPYLLVLGGAFALLAFSLPTIAAGFH